MFYTHRNERAVKDEEFQDVNLEEYMKRVRCSHMRGVTPEFIATGRVE
jgi:hypothetical protein